MPQNVTGIRCKPFLAGLVGSFFERHQKFMTYPARARHFMASTARMRRSDTAR
jgi:hypothetical protein